MPTSYDGAPITYDAMGNPTGYMGLSLSWEGKQLVSAERTIGSITSTYSFSYDENGLRTRKTFTASFGGNSASVHTDYYYNGSVLIGMKSGSKLMRFSYDAGGNVVSVDHSTDNGSTYETYYYLRNAQGDIVKLIDSNGNTVVEYLYDSWGKAISVMGTLATTLGADQPFRYRGYVYDEETGWYYLQSRYYDPTICRFISADILLSTGQGVIGHNSFAYCLNMPTNGADSHGHVFRPYSVQMTDSGSGNAAYYATVLVNRYKGKSKAFLTLKIKNKSFFGAQARSVNSDKKSQLSLKSLNPIYYETGERSVTTISSSGFSDSPVSVYAENRLDNVLTSSVGINVNTNSATFNVNLGADNIGMYSMHHDGSSTSYVGIVVDCSSLRAGLECGVIESICDVETTYYNSIGINGLGAFAFAVIAYEIYSTGTSPTLEQLCSELYAY